MKIKKIELKNFRNYAIERFYFDDKINLLTGENGQGKTNLLEALYVCSYGKSFRTFKDVEMIEFDKDFCRIVCDFERQGSGVVEIAINRTGKKIGKVNGVKIEKKSELVDNVLVVIFSPEDLKIVKEDPEKRRRFIDNEMSQLSISYYKKINGYQRILNHRNKLLKGDIKNKENIKVWDLQLVEYGEKIIKERAEFIKKINLISCEIHKQITEGKEKLKIEYAKDIKDGERFEEILNKTFEKDVYRGFTTRGPHKDDIEIYIDEMNVKKYGSQGQQRTVALALKLAEIKLIEEEKNENPILLLDDVFSELDSSRQRYLVDFLGNTQIFITAADISEKVIKSFPEGKEFKIKDGKIN